MAEDTLGDFEASLAQEFADRGLTGDEPEETTPTEPEQLEVEPAAESDDAQDDGRQRDDKGRFVAQEPERPTWLPDKFKSEEDFARSYSELEQRLGQTSGEREELNRLRQQMEGLVAAEQRRSQAPADWEGLIDENPEYAARLAYQQGNEAAFRAAAAAWDELSPGTPAMFVETQRLGQYVQQLGQHVEARFQPVQEDVQTRETARVFNDLATSYPDFDKYADQIAEAANGIPEVVGMLLNGDFDSKKRVVESLYWMARGRASDNLTEAAQQAAQTATQEARARKMGATVASASTSPATPAGDAISRFTDGIVEAAKNL